MTPERPVILNPLPPPARLGGPRGLPPVPAVYPSPAREAVIGDGQPVEVAAVAAPAAPPPVARPAADRWQPLRDALGRCDGRGMIERAMCEQGARLAHCDGYWGNAPLCPAGRTEFGQ
jgi:hypothetical protein